MLIGAVVGIGLYLLMSYGLRFHIFGPFANNGERAVLLFYLTIGEVCLALGMALVGIAWTITCSVPGGLRYLIGALFLIPISMEIYVWGYLFVESYRQISGL